MIPNNHNTNLIFLVEPLFSLQHYQLINFSIHSRFGRKRILMFMVLAQTTLALLSLMVRSYFQYVVLRLFVGFVSVSVVYAAFVLAVEIVGGKWVTIAGVCNFFPLPLAYIIVSLVSLLLPDWRNLTLALSIPGCSLLILWYVFATVDFKCCFLCDNLKGISFEITFLILGS